MENISLPSKIEFSAESAHKATVSIQPCFPGYGTTLGNALRRVLLSSLPGAAVTAFRIKGATHEFSTLEHVKEDLVEISLNLKQLRLKIHGTQPVKLTLHAKGERHVTAKDIAANSDVEIGNPDLLIATLTHKTAEIDIELIATPGRGYLPTEAREKENLEVGMIAIDAIFTPVRNVGFSIENVRVGQMTNFENLVLVIETDATITPQQALAQATALLLEHFNFIADHVAEAGATVTTEAASTEEASSDTDSDDEEETSTDPDAKPKKRGRPKKEKAD